MEDNKDKKSLAKKILVPSLSDFYPKSTVDAISSFSNTISNIVGYFKMKRTKQEDETFAQAVERLGVSKKELKSIYKNYTILAWMFALCTAFCFSQIIYAFIFGHMGNALFPTIFGFVFSLSAFKYSFRAFQIKTRNLCSIADFLASKKYLPTLEKNKNQQ